MKDEKILNEEQLSDEELEQVSGGGARQVCGDNDLLKMLGCNHWDGTFGINVHYPDGVEIVRHGWSQVGIRMVADGDAIFGSSYYSLNGSPISRKAAFVHAMKQKGWSDSQIESFDWKGVKGAW